MQRSDSNGLQGREEVFLKHESEINTPVSHRWVWNVWITRSHKFLVQSALAALFRSSSQTSAPSAGGESGDQSGTSANQRFRFWLRSSCRIAEWVKWGSGFQCCVQSGSRCSDFHTDVEKCWLVQKSFLEPFACLCTNPPPGDSDWMHRTFIFVICNNNDKMSSLYFTLQASCPSWALTPYRLQVRVATAHTLGKVHLISGKKYTWIAWYPLHMEANVGKNCAKWDT